MSIKIYNPRHLLRKGSAAMMNDVIDGHIVILRCGEVEPQGAPVLINPKTGNAGPQFDKVRGKVFKLVEVTEPELTRLQRKLRLQ